jgi:hypothetical protein
MTRIKVTVARLPEPRREGDWHDSPLRWQVQGPEAQIQLFSTKKDAQGFARLVRDVGDHHRACALYSRLT